MPATLAAPQGDVVIQWNRALLAAIQATKTPPPIASRAMAIVQVAVHDTINAIEQGQDAYAVQVTAPAVISESAAVSEAAYDTLLALFPSQQAALLVPLRANMTNVPASQKAASIRLGDLVAHKMLALRADDGSATVMPYTPLNIPGNWQPTPPAFAPALLPSWGMVTPFGLSSILSFRPPPPPALNSSAYTDAFNELETLGGKNSTARTADETQIALFWNDPAGTSTPPGHWNDIAESLALSQHLTMAQEARLFAVLDMALADAGIAAWDAKYAYNYWRPVTAIRDAANDGNPDTTADASWTPLLTTPNFPSYVSGHSTFSAAAAEVLTALFGDNFHFSATSESLPGVTRSFTSFRQAAQEAGMSRIYGGIHWQFDNQSGLATGTAVGDAIVSQYLGTR